MICGIMANQGVASACAYPLNDDGTIAAAIGYGYAGPAIGDGQRMQYTLGAGGGVKILVAGAATTTARFHRGELPIGFEAVVNDYLWNDAY